MTIPRKAIMVATTFLLAAATGHLMQNSDSLGQRGQIAPAPVDMVTVAHPSAKLEHLARFDPDQPGAALSVGLGKEFPIIAARNMVDTFKTVALDLDEGAAVSGFSGVDGSCAAARLVVEPAPHALLSVSVNAPCHPLQSAVVSHGPLRFTVTTDANGAWSGLMPAWAREARVDLQLHGSAGLSAEAVVEGIERVNRVALSWRGDADLHLNAYEYGSDFDGPGHIHAGAPRTPDTPLGGHMMRFGATVSDYRVEVYSAPADMHDIQFELEAIVDAQTCERDVQAEIISMVEGEVEKTTSVSVAMPGCDDPAGAVLMELPIMSDLQLAALGR